MYKNPLFRGEVKNQKIRIFTPLRYASLGAIQIVAVAINSLGFYLTLSKGLRAAQFLLPSPYGEGNDELPHSTRSDGVR
jgi:hypothetical protein